MRTGDFIKLLVSIAMPLLAGFGSTVFTVNSIPKWYASLNKP
jgi:tryptophan-rich sensory protein